jgi:hypothetical protein
VAKQKISLGGPRHRWEGDIKTELAEIECDMDWIHLPQDRDQWRALLKNLLVPYSVG